MQETAQNTPTPPATENAAGKPAAGWDGSFAKRGLNKRVHVIHKLYPVVPTSIPSLRLQQAGNMGERMLHCYLLQLVWAKRREQGHMTLGLCAGSGGVSTQTLHSQQGSALWQTAKDTGMTQLLLCTHSFQSATEWFPWLADKGVCVAQLPLCVCTLPQAAWEALSRWLRRVHVLAGKGARGRGSWGSYTRGHHHECAHGMRHLVLHHWGRHVGDPLRTASPPHLSLLPAPCFLAKVAKPNPFDPMWKPVWPSYLLPPPGTCPLASQCSGWASSGRGCSEGLTEACCCRKFYAKQK